MEWKRFGELSKREDKELGNVEIDEKGNLVHREGVSARDEIENEAEYRESKEWGDALDDFKKTWDSLDLSVFSEEVRKAIHDPEWFMAYIDRLLERYDSGRVGAYLEQKYFEFEKLREEVQSAKESVVNNMLDFKKTHDNDLNDEIKERFDGRIVWMDKTLSKTDEIISYIKEKQTELLL